MAIFHCDGFDHYGSTAAGFAYFQQTYFASNMGSGNISTAKARTGAAAILLNSFNVGFRYAFPSAKAITGIGFGVCFTSMPTGAPVSYVIFKGNGGANNLAMITFTASGGINVVDGNNGYNILGQSPVNVIQQNVYHWLELKTYRTAATVATLEVRIDGSPVIIVNGITVPAFDPDNVLFGQLNVGGGGVWHLDDLVCWDGTGTQNNDWLGSRRVQTCLPNSDDALAQWTKSTGTVGYGLIDNVPPDDAQYIEAVNNGDVSQFGKDAITALGNAVAAIRLVSRAKASDAASTKFRQGINSNGFAFNGSEKTLTTTFATYSDIIEQDPNGSIPWTRPAVDAAKIRLTRTL